MITLIIPCFSCKSKCFMNTDIYNLLPRSAFLHHFCSFPMLVHIEMCLEMQIFQLYFNHISGLRYDITWHCFELVCILFPFAVSFYNWSKSDWKLPSNYSRICFQVDESLCAAVYKELFLCPIVIILWMVAEVSLTKLPLDECHGTLLMMSQHWFR